MGDIFSKFDQSELSQYKEFESFDIAEYNRLLLDFCHYCYESVVNSEKYLKCLSLQLDITNLSVEVPDELKDIGLSEIDITYYDERDTYYLFNIIYEQFILMLDYRKVIDAYESFLLHKVINRKAGNVKILTSLRDMVVDEFKYYTYRCLGCPYISMTRETKVHLGNGMHYLTYSREKTNGLYLYTMDDTKRYITEETYNDRYLIPSRMERELLQYKGYFLVYVRSVTGLFVTELTERGSSILFYLDMEQIQSPVCDVLVWLLQSEKARKLGVLNILMNVNYNSFTKKVKKKIKELVLALNQHLVDVRFLDTYR